MRKLLLLLVCIFGITQIYAQWNNSITTVDSVEYRLLNDYDGATITHYAVYTEQTPVSKLVLRDTVILDSRDDKVPTPYPVVETGGYDAGRSGIILNPFYYSVIDSLYFPNTLRKVGQMACEGSTFKYVYIPPMCSNIDFRAFFECSIDSIALPKSLQTIGSYTFEKVKFGMEGIELPDDVTIGDEAFAETNLKHIVIHNASISRFAFAENKNLQTVTFDNTTQLELSGKEIFRNCTALTSIELPPCGNMIYESTFAGCSALEHVVIPEGVELIEEKAFDACTSLKTITIKAEIPPTLADMNVFPDYRTPTLIVPKGCRKYYEKAPFWMYFVNIVEEDEEQEEVYYKLSFVHTEGSTSMLVPRGERLTLQFTPSTGYRIHSVTYDGSDITSLLEPDNTFVTPRIYGDVVVSVAYETDADGVASAAHSPVKVSSEGQRIVVSHCRPGETVSLYLSDGSVAAVSRADGSGTAVFAASESGIYIVRTSEKSVKLRTGM